MQIFLLILTQNCETCINEGHSWLWDLLKDFMLPIVLAIGAGFFAYDIFVRETKRDKLKEEAQRNNEKNDKLFYITALLQNIIHLSLLQKDYIKNHIRKINNNEVDFHIMHWTTLNDFDRITDKLDLEEYLLAYTNHFNRNTKVSVKEFKNIIISVDYLQGVFMMMQGQLKESMKFDYERKIRFQTVNAAIQTTSQKLALILLEKDQEEYLKLTKIKFDFNQKSKENKIVGINYDLVFQVNNYFIPLDKFCLDYARSGKPMIQEVIDLGNSANEAINLLEYIKSQNRHLKSSLCYQFKNIYRSIIALQKHTKNLFNDFG